MAFFIEDLGGDAMANAERLQTIRTRWAKHWAAKIFEDLGLDRIKEQKKYRMLRHNLSMACTALIEATTPKIRIWLDDKRVMPADFTHHALTAWEAIALLKTGNVTHVGFDHDLGREEIVGSGYTVAKWIEEQAAAGSLTPLQWSIQSSNGPGRENIAAAMRSAERFWINPLGDDNPR